MAEPHPIPTGPRFQNLNGRVFGKLTVLFYAGRKNEKYSLWHCRCECGEERTVVSSALTLGRTTSCLRCFRHKPKSAVRSDFQDLTGQTFGRLTVAMLDRQVKSRGGSKAYWLCTCSCGETVIVRGDSLRDGKIQSCGCLTIVRRWQEEPKPQTRQCPSCHVIKPLDLKHFYRHPSGKYGFLPRCRKCIKEQKRREWQEHGKAMRMRVLIHYGGDPPKCACCGEAHVEFLAIDHVKGGGTAHRQKVGPIYPWLIRNHFPEGFRVLCHNCNMAFGRYGYCPHKRQS